jgi:hypothetical protein
MSVSRVCEDCGKEWPAKSSREVKILQCDCGGHIVECDIVDSGDQPDVIPLATAIPEALLAEEGDTVPLIHSSRPIPRKANRTLNYQVSKSLLRGTRDPSDLLLGHKWRDFYLPICFILLGSILYYGHAIYRLKSVPEGILAASLQMTINTLVTISVVLFIRRLADMDFGTATGTILKLTSVAIFPNAVGSAAFDIGGACVGSVVGLTGSLFLCLTMFMKLFDAGLGEGVLCVTLVTIFNFVSWGWAERVYLLFFNR